MKTVYKYTLNLDLYHTQTVMMPEGTDVLSVQVQHGNICLWCLVDPEKQKEPRGFIVRGTGHILPDDPLYYHGSIMLDNGTYVFHIFEVE